MNDKYILDEKGNPIPEPNLLKWGRWMQTSEDRFVARTTVGESVVSTVFLGLDHQFGKGPPIGWSIK